MGFFSRGGKDASEQYQAADEDYKAAKSAEKRGDYDKASELIASGDEKYKKGDELMDKYNLRKE